MGMRILTFVTDKAEFKNSFNLKLKWFSWYPPLQLDSETHMRVVLGLHNRFLARYIGNCGQERGHPWEGHLYIRETWTNGCQPLVILKIMPLSSLPTLRRVWRVEGKVEPFPFLHTSSEREAISVAWNSKGWGERKNGSNDPKNEPDFIQKESPMSQKAQAFQCHLLQMSHCPMSSIPVAAFSPAKFRWGIFYIHPKFFIPNLNPSLPPFPTKQSNLCWVNSSVYAHHLQGWSPYWSRDLNLLC